MLVLLLPAMIVFLLDPLAKVLDRLTRRRWLCRQCVVFPSLPGCPARPSHGRASLRLGVRVTGSASLSLHGRLRLSRDPQAGRAGGPGGPDRRRKPCGPAGSVSVWHAVAGPPAGRPGAAAPASRHRRARPYGPAGSGFGTLRPAGSGGGPKPPPRTPPPTPDLPLPGQARAGIGPADSEFKHWLGT